MRHTGQRRKAIGVEGLVARQIRDRDPEQVVESAGDVAHLDAFARYWGFMPRACAPYRARTKGMHERGVGNAKRNAVTGRRFAS